MNPLILVHWLQRCDIESVLEQWPALKEELERMGRCTAQPSLPLMHAAVLHLGCSAPCRFRCSGMHMRMPSVCAG